MNDSSPTVFVVDDDAGVRKGVVRLVKVGSSKKNAEELEETIKKLVEEK